MDSAHYNQQPSVQQVSHYAHNNFEHPRTSSQNAHLFQSHMSANSNQEMIQ